MTAESKSSARGPAAASEAMTAKESERLQRCREGVEDGGRYELVDMGFAMAAMVRSFA